MKETYLLMRVSPQKRPCTRDGQRTSAGTWFWSVNCTLGPKSPDRWVTEWVWLPRSDNGLRYESAQKMEKERQNGYASDG